MTLREAAIAAYQASQEDKTATARSALAGVLDPFDVSTLTVADIQPGGDFVRFVFTDDDVSLAVVLRDGASEVALVSGSPGEWTRLAVVTSLAELGRVLPGLLPAPDVPDAWAPGVAYQVGDEVSYGGVTYRCVQAHTAQVGWEPPNVPALWSVA